MKSKKLIADNFIKLHLEKYGLNGTNTQKNPPANFPVWSAKTSEKQLSQITGVKFGYNGQVFNWRESSTCMFWVDYGNESGALPTTFLSECLKAVDQIANRYSTFSIPFLGSTFSQVLLSIVSETQHNYRITIPACLDCPALNFESEFNSKINFDRKYTTLVETIEFSEEEFVAFLREMTAEVRCADPIVAFSAFIGARSQFAQVYHSPWPEIRDENFDIVGNKAVGPSNWNVVDNESHFAIARYLLKKNKEGIHNLFYSYPNIFFAILNEAVWKQWIKKAMEDSDRQSSSENFLNGKFLAEYFPNLYEPTSWISGISHLLKFKEELLQHYPKANEAWLTPLYRLIEKRKIHYDFQLNLNESIYGLVL